ncbi:hypothetical protein [Clostridium thailandense]|uniref:hypothetical protein n=1 Tax=Clostridium thailandense TaxID=2794346 RepID=UPI003989E36A
MLVQKGYLLFDEVDGISYQIGAVYRVNLYLNKNSLIADGNDKITINIEVNRYDGKDLDTHLVIPIKIGEKVYNIEVNPDDPNIQFEFTTTVAGDYNIKIEDIPIEAILSKDVITATGTTSNIETYEALKKQIDTLNIALANIMGV